jgi:hypothetical protein
MGIRYTMPCSPEIKRETYVPSFSRHLAHHQSVRSISSPIFPSGGLSFAGVIFGAFAEFDVLEVLLDISSVPLDWIEFPMVCDPVPIKFSSSIGSGTVK